ncbi:MAG: AMP-binding protein [Bacteroidota bacterium]
MSEVSAEQRPWLKNYPSGIPANINADQYCSVVEMLEESFQKYKQLPAFTCMGKTFTYGEIDKLSLQFGAYLQSRGLKKGDKIALMMPNLLQYPIALFGAIRAGLIVVNTNPLYTPREMEHQFVDAEVSAIVILENFAFNLQKILGNTNINIVITTSIGELLPTVKGAITNFVVRKIKKMVPAYDIPNTVSFKEALAGGKKFKLQHPETDPNEVAFLQYTGGTTGRAKGAMLTHRNVIANMLQIKAIMSPFVNEQKETMLCPLPMYHIFAFTVNTLAPMNSGFHNILIVNPRDLKTVVKAFKDHSISLMTGVNTLYNALLNNQEFASLDLSGMKIAAAGATALQRPVAEKWQQVTGMSISEGYGMTEASPVVTSNPYDGTGRVGTIGIPIPSTDVRIVDETGTVLGPNQAGEIQVKGPQVMKGYYKRPDATADTIKEGGWLCTGDIGEMSEDGYFSIVDRKKDMILVSGFNVYPNEIEEVVAGHPKVMEAAAIGVADEKSGEVVKIFVIKKDKSLTKDELIQYCRENLTGYKVPKQVEFRSELPKSTVGKILRKDLRDA